MEEKTDKEPKTLREKLNQEVNKAAVEEFKAKKEEEKKTLKSLGPLALLMRFPEPKRLISLGLFITTVLYIWAYTPAIVRWLLGDYVTKNSDIMTWLYLSAFLNLLAVLLAVFIPWDVTIPWMWAKMKHKPMLISLTKNRTLRFLVPKDVMFNVWGINEEATIEPDPDAIYIGPSKVPCMLMIPEVAKGINLRRVLDGKDFNLDVTAYKQYAKWFEQKAWAKARQFTSNITPWIMPLLLVLIIGGGLYTFLDKKMDQTNAIDTYQTKLETCRLQLADNGIQFKDATPTTQTPKEDNVKVQKEAQPDVKVT